MITIPKTQNKIFDLFITTKSDTIKIMLLLYVFDTRNPHIIFNLLYINNFDTRNPYVDDIKKEYFRILTLSKRIINCSYYSDTIHKRGSIIINKFFRKILNEYNNDNNFNILAYVENLNVKYEHDISNNHALDILKGDEKQLVDILNEIISFSDNDYVISIDGINMYLDYFELQITTNNQLNTYLKFKLTKKRCKFGKYGIYILDSFYQLKGKIKYINLLAYNREYKLMEIAHL